ncbi:MAG: hypothetical protein EA369_09235 [Bradymonadales bacterium]|nr:MAG: hypothetical protein EA369_09235 [Bradymonadales bacterium]
MSEYPSERGGEQCAAFESKDAYSTVYSCEKLRSEEELGEGGIRTPIYGERVPERMKLRAVRRS